MLQIIILILLGMLLIGVELFLLPGVSIAGIGALIVCGFAAYKSFVIYGTTGGLITIGIILILSIIVLIFGLRAKTWRRLTLKENIDSSSQSSPENDLKIGDKGTTLTRLAPIGKIMVNGNTYEAKSVDVYIDPRKEIEVVGFENFSVVVKLSE